MISVTVDDLAFVPADAVLRAADHLLEPAGRSAARLDELGGEALRRARRVQSPLAVGSAVVTGAGDLTAPLVLHLVLRDDAQVPSRDVVRRSLVSAWHRAREWAFATVAAPPIGTGPGGLDLEDAVALLCETWRAAAPDAGMAALVLVVETVADKDAAEAVVRRVQPAGAR
ncbi:MAG: macro domain-containing protein [Gemmatimonadales bacterium]|nr:macro domain-containing protein [Gemmatimonadales bacterium]